jgi:hypothetical protein
MNYFILFCETKKQKKSYYNRAHRFNEVLLLFQGKEKAIIPSEVIEDVRNHMIKFGHDIQSLTRSDVRCALRSLLEQRKYYVYSDWGRHIEITILSNTETIFFVISLCIIQVVPDGRV